MTVAPLRNSVDPSADVWSRESDHRIANHLALLSAMIQVQASAVARGPNPIARDQVQSMLREMAGRIVAIGHLHRRLASQPGASVENLGDYLLDACTTLVASLGLERRVSLVQTLTANCHVTHEQAQLIGLMVNEIILNAAKHAHPTGIPVQIALVCRKADDGRMTIEIGDDGVGLPEGSGVDSPHGVGFKLIRSLAASLKAELRIESDSLGLTFLIVLPAVVAPICVAAR